MAFGDRKDAKLVKNIDGMHFICPIIYPNRCDNEAFISEVIDLTKIDEYLQKKNLNNDSYQYNLFQVMVTSTLKLLYLREKLNYFVANSNLYERYEKTISFVIKKEFNDKASEGLAVIKSKANYTIDDIHSIMETTITSTKSGKNDSSSNFMDIFTNKIPRVISKNLVKLIRVLDRHGLVPSSMIESDPYYCSIVLTNLGSIKLHAGYHHLTNWGSNSIFVVIGERKLRPFYDENGNVEMRNSVDLGLTIDERIADGYYFSRSVALLKKILENPEVLDEPLDKEIDY